MGEKKNALPLGTSQEEAIRNDASAAAAALENLKKKIREETETEFVQLVRELGDVDRSIVPDVYQNAEHKGVTEVRNPTHPLYRRLTAEEREWRNPDSDHYMAEWIRGLVAQDHGRMLLADEKLQGLFRAITAEGAASTTGGFSAGTGGVLLPRPMEAVVMIARDRVAKARRFVTIYEMTTQTATIPTAGSMTYSMVAESADLSATNNEPTLGSVPLIAQTAVVRAVATKQMLADSAYNIVNIFATRGGAALGVLEDNEVFKTGTGVAPHITKLAGTVYAEPTTGRLGYSDVIAMYYGVPQQYRDNAIWLASADVLQGLAGDVKDGNGRPFYQGLNERPLAITDDPSAVGTILGKRVYEVPFTAGDIWFGDAAAAYAFGSRQGITVEMSEHSRFALRQVEWQITERFAGNNVDASASQYASGITSFTSS